MSRKVITFLILINIVHIQGSQANYGRPKKTFKLLANPGEPGRYDSGGLGISYIIEDKKTGLVMTEVGTYYEMMKWNNTNSQLWTLEQEGSLEQYIVRNVASTKGVGCIANGIHYSLLNLHISHPGSITIKDPYIVLKQENNKVFCVFKDPSSQSDDWIFTQFTQSQNFFKKFVIENMNTGKALEVTGRSVKTSYWENRDSQLWTLKKEGNGYSLVNVATGGTLTHTKNNKNYRIMKLNPRYYTRIQAEDSNAFLTDLRGVASFVEYKQHDGSDKWLLTQQENKTRHLSYNIIRRIL